MEKSLAEITALVGGELEGDGSLTISGVAGIREARPGDVTFLSNPKYVKDLGSTKASAVIISPGTPVGGLAAVRVKNPYLAFAKVVALFAPAPRPPLGVMEGACVGKGVSLGRDVTIYPGAYIDDGASIGDRAVIYPGVYIGPGSALGEDCILYPNVVVREKVRIGARVIIHGGSVIGADGFGYATEGGWHYKIPQIGGVVIEDDVEIGANATVDRGALGDTVIKKGAKIDNLVMIAHNVVVGEGSIIVAQAGISGSTELGHHVVLAGQVGLVGHIKVGDMVTVGAQSGVMNDIESCQVYSGSPALPHKEWLKAQAVLPKLPEMRKTLNELARRVSELEKDRDQTGRK